MNRYRFVLHLNMSTTTRRSTMHPKTKSNCCSHIKTPPDIHKTHPFDLINQKVQSQWFTIRLGFRRICWSVSVARPIQLIVVCLVADNAICDPKHQRHQQSSFPTKRSDEPRDCVTKLTVCDDVLDVNNPMTTDDADFNTLGAIHYIVESYYMITVRALYEDRRCAVFL